MSINLYRPEVYSPEKWFAVQKEEVNGYFCPEIYEQIIDASPYIERKYFEYSLVCAQWCCLVRVRILKLINNKNLFKNNALGLSSEANQLAFLSAYKDRCKVLTVDYFFSRETFLNLIPSLSQLIELHLNSLPWLTNDILRELTSLRSLSTLAIIGIENGITDEQFESIALFSNLKALEIKCRITDKTIHEIGKIQGLSKLKLKAASITDEGLKQLRSLPLTELDLSDCKAITGKPLSYFINTLISLNLKDCVNVGSSSFRWIAQLVNLVKLNINGTSVNNGELNHLKMLTKLSKLKLNFDINDEGFIYLTSLENLSKFFMDCRYISDEGIKLIKNFTSLTSLQLNFISVNNFDFFNSLTNLSHLSIGSFLNNIEQNIHFLNKLTNLTKLEIIEPFTTNTSCMYLTNLQKISKLSLQYLNDSNKEFRFLSSLKDLSYLSCEGFIKDLSKDGLDQLAKLTNLSYLKIPSGKLRVEDLHRLAALKNLSTFFYGDLKISPLRRDWFLEHSSCSKSNELHSFMDRFIGNTVYILCYAFLPEDEVELLKKIIEIYQYDAAILNQMVLFSDRALNEIHLSSESVAFLLSQTLKLILENKTDGITENGKKNAEKIIRYLKNLAESQYEGRVSPSTESMEQGVKRKAETEMVSRRPLKKQKIEHFIDEDIPTMDEMEFLLDKLYPDGLESAFLK